MTGKAGRPSTYTEELADEICDRIANGESLRKICDAERDDFMPDRRTVLRWLAEDEQFATKYAHAREAQADVMDEKILETAETCTVADYQVARVKIAAYQWRAEKLKAKVYGPKLGVHGVEGAPPIQQAVEATVRFVRPGEV